MGIPHTLKVLRLGRDVAKNGPLADPKRLGSIPFSIRQHKRIIPTLLHDKKITFGEQVSEAGKNRSRRVWYPNVQYISLYSRALDMNIWTRISTAALREIDHKGGFDEYIISVADKLLPCEIAKMYRDRILKQYDANTQGTMAGHRNSMLEMLGKVYGEDYTRKLEEAFTEQDYQLNRRYGQQLDK